MKHLKSFFSKIAKNDHGYVPDILDMSENDKDNAVVAVLFDSNIPDVARAYDSLSNEDKNDAYQSLEIVIQDAIEEYNQTIDDSREQAKKAAEALTEMDDNTFMDLIDPNRKYTGSYRAMLDSGHRTTDF
jgi:hypothetical protein